MSELFKLQDTDAVTGITTTVERVEGAVRIGKTWDAEPFLEVAAAERAATAGERWGEGRKVGTVPMAVLGMFLRQDGGLDVKRCAQWLKENPAFITFDKYKL